MKKSNFNFKAIVGMSRILFFAFLFYILSSNGVRAQIYNAVGNPSTHVIPQVSPGCYRLTDGLSQGGAVWNVNPINLLQDFQIILTLNFGTNPGTSSVGTNCGADGMSFTLQPTSASQVGLGSGAGFLGINPSFGVIMDDFWGNATDPPYHHISINKSGDVDHTTFTPAYTPPVINVANANELTSYTTAIAFPANITDGLNHLFKFKWTAATLKAEAWFGTATTLPVNPTITYTGNISAFLGNTNSVYWGVTASTGGCWNNQTVCMTTASNFGFDTTVCAGDTMHFSDQSNSGTQITAYSWDFGDGYFSTLQNPIHIYNTPGTYSVNLQIFAAFGYTANMTHNITIHPKPTVVVNNPLVCAGDTATLTATGATTYTWNNGLTPGAVKKVAPITTTSYIVTGTNAFGCKNKDTALVTIYPNPIVSATTATICKGDSATITASGASTYKWTPTNSTANPLKISPPVTTTYTVIGTSTDGCKDTATTQVTVNNNPVITVANDTICLNEIATLTANGAVNYVWGNNVSTSNPYTVSPAVTTLYTVVGTDANNCIGKDSAKVVVYMPPVISVDSAEICIGALATLTVSGGNNLTYLWTNNNTTLNPLKVSPTNTTLYTVIATDIHGCKDTASGNVFVHLKPIPAFLPSSTLVSTDSPDVSFTEMSTNPFSWLWNFGDVTSPDNSSTIQSPVHSFSGAGEFVVWLVVTTDFGCMDSTYRLIKVISPVAFYIPNAFDPLSTNTDINEFRPKGVGLEFQKYEMIIFDRWGKEIFKTTDFYEGWNGKYNNTGEYLPHGVYVYYVKYKEVQGNYKERTGSVTMIR